MKKGIAIVVGCISIFVGFFLLYVSDYYTGNDIEIIEYRKNYDVNVSERKGYKLYGNEASDTGIIFYPGGKVEAYAYEPLMVECASRGLACVLVEMPFNLAVFDIDAALEVRDEFKGIDRWFIGGHSLGGAMAAQHLSDRINAYDGLLLLGSYSTVDISNANIAVLSIYGSNDKVLNKDKYNECVSNLPDDYHEMVIEGANHAYFGMYGEQDKDGVATITNEEQIKQTIDIIFEFTNK